VEDKDGKDRISVVCGILEYDQTTGEYADQYTCNDYFILTR
jgi:hypothetical protein